VDHFWRELDDAVLACLADGNDTPSEISRQLGISEPAASSILTMLVVEGRVRISRVSLGNSQGAGHAPAEPIA
jgi:DNA-binding Lrp family transcriptional regulator